MADQTKNFDVDFGGERLVGGGGGSGPQSVYTQDKHFSRGCTFLYMGVGWGWGSVPIQGKAPAFHELAYYVGQAFSFAIFFGNSVHFLDFIHLFTEIQFKMN